MAQRVAQLACLFAATSLAACGHATATGQSTISGTPTATPGWTATTLTNVGSPVSIEHPTTWQFVTSDDVSLGWSSIAAYFTNAPTMQQCHTKKIKGGEQIDCNGPVARLIPGQVLVTVTNISSMGPNIPFTANTVVDGRPAATETLTNPQICPTGTGEARTLDVPLPPVGGSSRSRGRLDVTVCMGQSGHMASAGAPVADADQLLRSITFPVGVHG